MLILLTYDVRDDRRRVRLAHTLKDFGERVQYSAFECRLRPEQLERLRERVRSLINPEEDSLRIYGLCRECGRRIESLGTGRVLLEDPEVYLARSSRRRGSRSSSPSQRKRPVSVGAVRRMP